MYIDDMDQVVERILNDTTILQDHIKNLPLNKTLVISRDEIAPSVVRSFCENYIMPNSDRMITTPIRMLLHVSKENCKITKVVECNNIAHIQNIFDKTLASQASSTTERK